MRYRIEIQIDESYKVGDRDNWGTLSKYDIVLDGPGTLTNEALSKFFMTGVMSINELGATLNINSTQNETRREEEQGGANQSAGGSDSRTPGGEGVSPEVHTEQQGEDILGD